MCTTNKNKPKKKYTHPPMEDSSKLENFDCLEYSEHLIDYEGNIGYSNEGFPVEVVCVNFGNGERMFLPVNNYKVTIRFQTLRSEEILTIRVDNLITGECKTVTQSHTNYEALREQTYPFQFQTSKGQRKNHSSMHPNPSQSYYKPLASQFWDIELSSYDEPKIISSGGDDGLTLGAISLFAAKYENVFKNYTSGSYHPITGGSNPMGWSAVPKTRYVPGLGDVNRSFMQQARSLLKYGGYGMTAYGFYQTQMAYEAGQISLAEYRGDIIFGIIGALGWQGAFFNFSYQMGKLNGSRHDYKPYESILKEHLK